MLPTKLAVLFCGVVIFSANVAITAAADFKYTVVEASFLKLFGSSDVVGGSSSGLNRCTSFVFNFSLLVLRGATYANRLCLETALEVEHGSRELSLPAASTDSLKENC